MFLYRRRLQFWFSNLKDFQEKYRQRKYKEILGVTNDCTKLQIKEKYLQLLRRYHPDRNLDLKEDVKKQNQQICKLIISAYDWLNKETHSGVKEEPKKSSTKNREPKNDEERIFYHIFGFYYEDDPYRYYKPENQHLRAKYEKDLSKYRATKGTSQKKQQKKEQPKEEKREEKREDTRPPPRQTATTKQQSSPILTIGIVAAFIVSVLIYKNVSKKQSKPKVSASVKKAPQKIAQKPANFFPEVKQIAPQEVKIQYFDKKKQFASYLKEQPPTLNYNANQNYTLDIQLFKYSVFPDIQLYEVPPRVFSDCQYYRFKDIKPKHILPIKNIKSWTLMTLSLEAERALQNIYVKRSYLLEQLKQHGQFKPPGICFRFYGYIYFRIRPGMPLNLSNVKPEDEWISLFDIYFKYYSPIPIRFNQYNFYSFPMRQSPQGQVSGSIHFNHRKIPMVYMEGDEKNVFMWKPQASNLSSSKEDQKLYERIWDRYYSQNHYQ